jgi:hypothetical protein
VLGRGIPLVNWKKALLQAVAVGLILCLGFTFLLGGFVLANYDNLGRLLRVVYLIDSQYLNDTPTNKLVDGAIDGMVSSLDPYSSFQDAEENQTLITSLHSVEYARKYFTRIIALKNGELFFDLPTEKVTDDLLSELYQLKEKALNEKSCPSFSVA